MIDYKKSNKEYYIGKRRGPSKYQIAQRETSPDREEEIKAVWDSPKFDTHNQRLVFLLRHCRNVNYGYTVREFSHGIFPDHSFENLAVKNVRQIFRRFRKGAKNHQVLLYSKFVDGKWYYYNMIEDRAAYKDVELRAMKISLGLERAASKIEGILEMSEEDMKILENRTIEKLESKQEMEMDLKKLLKKFRSNQN